MKKIVGIGEVLWDLLPQGKQPGGAPANFAYHVMQLGFDGYAVSAIGKDELGSEIADFLQSKKVNALMEKVDYPTGIVEVHLDVAGVPTYNICEDVAWDNISLTPQMRELAQETDAVCFGTLAMRNPISRECINQFIDLVPSASHKIFDINLRQHYYSKELIESSLNKCNILKVNDDEIKILMELLDIKSSDEKVYCKELMQKYNLELLILTKGTEGSIIFSQDGSISEKPTPVVDVVDTIGAGDAFTAAFIVNIMKGHSVTEAHDSAIQVSAFVCSCKGAMPVYQ